MIQSTATNKAEKDHPDNLSLAGDGFDTVVKAKEAVDEVSSCKNKVSCADILALATRDVVALVWICQTYYLQHLCNTETEIQKRKRTTTL